MDLESVITQSIENSVAGDEGGDSGGDVVDDSPETDGSSTEDTTGSGDAADAGAEAEADGDADAADAAAATTERRTPARIRWKQHEKLVQKATAQLQKDLEARDARLKTLAWAEQQGAEDALRAFSVLEADPDRGFAALMTDPRYVALIEARVKAALAEQPKSPPVAAAPSARPKPDVLNADGSVGYSEEGFQAALAYERAEAVKEALAEMRREQDEKFGPVLKDREERAKYEASLSKMGKALNEAREELPQFKEHETEIKAWLNAQWQTPGGRRANLLQGWKAVVLPKLQAERNKMRTELLEEINSKKEAAIKPPASNGSPKAAPNGPRDLTEVINDSIRSSGLR